MAKRNTLVKNKRKKRQTKKRILKKYIGGNDRETHDFLSTRFPEINEKIMSCFEGDKCHRKEITQSIMQTNLNQYSKTEILNYVDRQMKLEVNEREGISKAKKHKLEETRKLREKEDYAIEIIEGRKDPWNEIKDILNTKCARTVETSGLNIREGTNSINLRSAYRNVMSAIEKFKSLESSLAPDEFKKKEKEFYHLLYIYATEHCNNFEVITKSVFELCLNEYYGPKSVSNTLELSEKQIFQDLISYECKRIIYNIDYSSWSGWRDQIRHSITRLFDFLNLYKNCLTTQFKNKVRTDLLDKICKIITFKRKSYFLDNNKCNPSIINDVDYLDFLESIDKNIKKLDVSNKKFVEIRDKDGNVFDEYDFNKAQQFLVPNDDAGNPSNGNFTIKKFIGNPNYRVYIPEGIKSGEIVYTHLPIESKITTVEPEFKDLPSKPITTSAPPLDNSSLVTRLAPPTTPAKLDFKKLSSTPKITILGKKNSQLTNDQRILASRYALEGNRRSSESAKLIPDP
jgi:hypothetical protein